MTELDISRVPRGALAAQALVSEVAEHGDLAERHYLELKSTLDLTTKKAKEKIAKFILGAANRMPDVAASAFEGYGVMIVGVAKDAITGVPPVEMMELAKVVQQYVGAAGPHWDIFWVPIEGSANQVLLVIVDPPKLGQGPYPCRASGETLTDGRIYIRAEGETREANSEEVDLLIQRGSAGSSVEVDFAVEVLGDVSTVSFDSATTVDEYVTGVRQRLMAALPRQEVKPSPTAPDLLTAAHSKLPIIADTVGITSILKGFSTFADSMTEPEDRTEEEYLDAVERWEARFRTAWDAALPKIAASQLAPAVVKISNRTTTFFHDVEVKLHLEGDISAFDYCKPEWADDFSDLKLPHPPRRWGPRQRTLGIPNYANMVPYSGLAAGQYVPPSISFRNGGSVSLDLDVGELRPRGSYKSEDDEIVLIVADHSLTSIHGTWELTARDHNEVYSGDIDVVVTGHRDFTDEARDVLGLRKETGV